MQRITRISDDSQIQQILELKKDLVDEPAHLRQDWLSEKAWIVVPVESGGHFNEVDGFKLSQGFDAVRCAEVYGVATEPLENFPLCYRVPTSKAGLLEFSFECSHYCFVLLQRDRSLAVLCTVFDYYLVAGSYQFVSRAVEGDIGGAWAEFNRVASEPLWEGRMQKVAKRYESFSRVVS